MSNSPVTFAPGALARSQALKSFRSAERLARYDITGELSKSVFLPCGGLVFAEVESGSPLSWTMAVLLSWPGRETFGPSDGAPTALGGMARIESRAIGAIGRNGFTCPPLRRGVPPAPGARENAIGRFGKARGGRHLLERHSR